MRSWRESARCTVFDAGRDRALLRLSFLPLSALLLVVGLLAGFRASLSALTLLLWAAVPCLLLLAVKRVRPFASLMLVLVLGAALGYGAMNPVRPAEGSVQVTGIVEEAELREDCGQVRVILRDVTLDGERVSSGAYWTYYLDSGETMPEELTAGARISAASKVYHPQARRNPYGFDFNEYLLERNMSFGLYGASELQVMPDGLSLYGLTARIRRTLSDRLKSLCGEESGQLASAVLLGMRSEMPEENVEQFRRLGIAHILSVSGYHVGILTAMLALLMRPMHRRKLRMALTFMLLLLYAFLTGGNAPAIRAVLLWGFISWGSLRHRQVMLLHVLCASAIVQLVFTPLQLLTASFQMTYGAMFALCGILMRTNHEERPRVTIVTRVLDMAAASAAAQFGVLLPELYFFGTIPMFGIVANVLLFLLMNALMTLDWVVLLLMAIPLAAVLPGMAAGAVSSVLLNAVDWLGQYSPVLRTKQPDIWTCIGWVLVWLALLPFGKDKSRWKNRLKRLPVFAVGIALMLTILLPVRTDGTKYIQLDVGDADAAILQHDDSAVIVDTGENGSDLVSYLQAEKLHVELLVLTHLHSDHAGGLADLLEDGIRIDRCILPEGGLNENVAENVRTLMERLEKQGTSIETVTRGDVIAWSGGTFTVLWPDDARTFSDLNEGSMALLSESEDVSMLLMGDLTSAYGQSAVVEADIIKAAHHGAKNGTTAELLAAVRPDAVIVSSDRENAAAYIRSLTDADVYATEEDGALTVRMKDGSYTIEAYVRAK